MKHARTFTIFFCLFLLLCSAVASYAGLMDYVNKAQEVINKQDTKATTSSSGSLTSLTTNEMVAGLKEALQKGIDNAVSSLGAPGGFLENPTVKIPMPDSLQTLEKAARTFGQDELADSFIASMNNAAEQAVPETIDIFSKAISSMSFADAKGILQGPDNAATEYLEKTSREALAERIAPIVSKATDAVGVTRKYKQFSQGATAVNMLSGSETLSSADIDSYVTDKSLDGLFTIMAEEEKKIRNNPVERSTELLKKVFGSL